MSTKFKEVYSRKSIAFNDVIFLKGLLKAVEYIKPVKENTLYFITLKIKFYEKIKKLILVTYSLFDLFL